jgi:hypothetical protein
MAYLPAFRGFKRIAKLEDSYIFLRKSDDHVESMKETYSVYSHRDSKKLFCIKTITKE